ncbi:MAG: hypothetical protein OXI30_16740 [Chloroflexota bacterium]|nr:hypothetical protein [Chloroflexota bacterium]
MNVLSGLAADISKGRSRARPAMAWLQYSLRRAIAEECCAKTSITQERGAEAYSQYVLRIDADAQVADSCKCLPRAESGYTMYKVFGKDLPAVMIAIAV